MFRFKTVLILLAAILAARTAVASISFSENFSANPFGPWSFGIGDNSNNQFAWISNAPPVYAGDATGELDVHLNSSLPTARFQHPLGVSITDTDNFTLTTRFNFHVISAPGDQGMQIAFGLVNSALTGGDRTGTLDNFSSDNTFSTAEFNYFPNAATTNDGPTLTPTVFGAQTSTNSDAFSSFATIFGNASILGTHTNGITSLPQDITLQAVLDYNGTNRTLTLTVSQVNSNGSTSVLDTEVPPLAITGTNTYIYSTYNTNFAFRVDSLAIMAYHDGFTTTNAPSLIADLRFQRLAFTTSATPPLPTIASIQIISTNVVLTFPTIINSLYSVQSRPDLVSGSWSTIASNIVGSGGMMTKIDVGAATAPARFYRVGVATP